jgi:hypothetical protein
MNRAEPSTMPGSHVLVESLDSIDTSEFTELLVHVVGSRTRVVSQPDTKVLDLEGTFLMDLVVANIITQAMGESNAKVSNPIRLPLEGCKGNLWITKEGTIYVRR